MRCVGRGHGTHEHARPERGHRVRPGAQPRGTGCLKLRTLCEIVRSTNSLGLLGADFPPFRLPTGRVLRCEVRATESCAWAALAAQRESEE